MSISFMTAATFRSHQDKLIDRVDATSSAIFSVLYCLARNPEKQEILRSEILKALPERDSPLTKENVASLPYLRACIKEAMRLIPVVSGHVRITNQDLMLQGYRVPKGTEVYMNNEAIYKGAKYFKGPESYIPERWLTKSERPKTFHSFVYLPFGYGNRNCVGQRFAKLEIESIIIRYYRLEWHYPEPEIETLSINAPRGDLKLRLCDY
ncbi:Cytochrome P450 [Sergentomyia squamirostris]